MPGARARRGCVNLGMKDDGRPKPASDQGGPILWRITCTLTQPFKFVRVPSSGRTWVPGVRQSAETRDEPNV
jgi:hypothetical protein